VQSFFFFEEEENRIGTKNEIIIKVLSPVEKATHSGKFRGN